MRRRLLVPGRRNCAAPGIACFGHAFGWRVACPRVFPHVAALGSNGADEAAGTAEMGGSVACTTTADRLLLLPSTPPPPSGGGPRLGLRSTGALCAAPPSEGAAGAAHVELVGALPLSATECSIVVAVVRARAGASTTPNGVLRDALPGRRDGAPPRGVGGCVRLGSQQSSHMARHGAFFCSSATQRPPVSPRCSSASRACAEGAAEMASENVAAHRAHAAVARRRRGRGGGRGRRVSVHWARLLLSALRYDELIRRHAAVDQPKVEEEQLLRYDRDVAEGGPREGRGGGQIYGRESSAEIPPGRRSPARRASTR